MKTILITGINGYMGSKLARELKNLGHIIIGLEYSLENVSRISDLNLILYPVKDGIPNEVFDDNKIDVIIHTATFYGRNNEDISVMGNANLFLPFTLLDKAIRAGSKLFINTDTVLDRFVSAYALTKRHFQEWLYMRRSEIKIINIQLEHFYGPGCANTNFITSMIERMKSNEPVINLTKGEQIRDFVYIDDVIGAFALLLESADHLPESYSSYQVASNQFIEIKELLLLLKELTNSDSILNFGAIEYRENELMKSQSDNSKLIALGWVPKFNLKEGLSQTVNS